MADLNEQQKTAIVIALARFSPPADVRAMMKEEFDIDMLIQHIVSYDPSRPAYRAGDKWVEIFRAERERYVTELSSIPAANQAFRVNMLNGMIHKAVARGNMPLAASLLKQVAEEVGGAYTNERNVKVEKTNGGFKDLTPEERRMAVSEMIREQLGKDAAQTAPSTGVTQ